MRYKATTFDYLQYLYNTTGFNDHQLHCVIKFDSRLDAIILEKAVNQLVKTVPILARKYIDKDGCSYWEDSSTIRKAELFTIVSKEKEFERFICSKTNEATGPQIKVCLFRSEKDCVAIVMNHMITDGAGFKQCLYLFASIYNNLSQNPDYVPSFIVDGDRSFKNVISNIPFFKKLKTLLFGRKENNQSSSETFPMSNTADTIPFILTYNVKPERYNQLLDFGKENNVTVNDVLLTAYIRALSKMLNINRKYLSIPIMVDMRRYLKEKSFKALTNLTSIATLRLRVYQDESFKETLYRVNSSMRTIFN
ncbi:MAG TPA: hypothetical protein VHQ24_08220 [Lachnospiraceae bacterium]|nr:hypothetical protein [Lachnospiraceae bacterium]